MAVPGPCKVSSRTSRWSGRGPHDGFPIHEVVGVGPAAGLWRSAAENVGGAMNSRSSFITVGGPVMPPTPAIRTATGLLDEAIRQLMQALPGCDALGHYEADIESLNLLRLIIRHVESVIALADRDLLLLPSAIVVARAAY